MALEAAVFSQDPLTSFNWYTLGIGVSGSSSSNNNWNYDFANSNYYPSKFEDKLLPSFSTTFDSNISYSFCNSNASPSEILIQNNNINNENDNNNNVNQLWDQYVNNSDYSSPPPEDGGCAVDQQYLSGEAPLFEVETTTAGGGGRRKRRRRSCKNKEEVEQQRMTHIEVERNRRKQMNEYLAVIRSLMPPSYVQRGDQASIVGGAINYVRELEHLLQSLEAQKRTKPHNHDHHHHDNHHQPPPQRSPESNKTADESASPPPVFAEFFSFPQYSTRSSSNSVSNNNSASSSSGEIEVSMVESHANVKILAKKQPKQLLRLVAAFQGLRLSVLHLNVTTLDPFVLYSLSLKVEEGCQLNSVDDIAAATNHILAQIQEDATSDLLS